MSKMSRFEVLDASCNAGAQYVVQDTRHMIDCYYHGACPRAAADVQAALSACRPVWQAQPYKASVWVYATFDELQVSRAVSVAEMAGLRDPGAYLGDVIAYLERSLHKLIAERARAGR